VNVLDLSRWQFGVTLTLFLLNGAVFLALKTTGPVRDEARGVARVVMTVVACIFLPLVLLYQGWTYWVFRKRIQS
jgi:cytochrome bd-type quinol oxidase subunit 2